MIPSREPTQLQRQTEAPNEEMEDAIPSKWNQKRSGCRPILILDKMISR